MYASVTGLKIKGVAQIPAFWWHALRSLRQARRSSGLVSASVKRVEGYQHTLSVWEDREAMRRFMTSDPHLAAIRAFSRIATGKTCGFETDQIPTWDDALAYWRTHGREY